MVPTGFKAWYERQGPLIHTLIGAVISVIIAQLAPWAVPAIRPPATEMIESQQVKINAGYEAALIINEVFGE